jgi:hypothetical protein
MKSITEGIDRYRSPLELQHMKERAAEAVQNALRNLKRTCKDPSDAYLNAAEILHAAKDAIAGRVVRGNI